MMDVEVDRFPVGMSVLVVDDNMPCLRILEKLLIKCNYHVTVATQAKLALKMLREKKDKFDIVISDVHMPEMDGFKLLELIGLELDIPVLMLSANDDPELVMKGVRHGAVDYLLKPVRIEELKNIWQHVVRKKKCSPNESDSEAGEDGTVQRSLDANGNSRTEEKLSRKRKEQINSGEHEDEDEEGSRNENGDPSTQKKPRVVWTTDLHKKFVNAVDQLGPDKAFPKKILDLMNVEGLTRENVASHLQKYRIYLKRMTSQSTQQTDPTATPFGAMDSSIYPNGGSMLNPYGVFCSLDSGIGRPSLGIPPTRYPIGPGGMLNRMNTAAGYRTGLSQTASSPGNGLLPNQNAGFPRLMDIDHFQPQSSNRGSVGVPPAFSVRSRDGFRSQSSLGAVTPDVKPQAMVPAMVPSLQDYTRCMENWQAGNGSRSTANQHQINRNQLPCSSFHTGFSSADVPHIQSAFQRSFTDGLANLSSPNEGLKGTQGSSNSYNVGYNTVEPQRWQQHRNGSFNVSTAYNNINPFTLADGSANPGLEQNSLVLYNGHVGSSAAQTSGTTSTLVQNTEVQDKDVDALMRIDENYLMEDTEYLAEFTQNSCETLEDLVGGLLR